MISARCMVRHTSKVPLLILVSTGEHFMAEMIESQDSDHITFVAEVCACVFVYLCNWWPVHEPQVAGRAVGFLTVTTEMDLTVLDKCFDLKPFHHLRKALPGIGHPPSPPTITTHHHHSPSLLSHCQHLVDSNCMLQP